MGPRGRGRVHRALRVSRKISLSVLLLPLLVWLVWCALWYVAAGGTKVQHAHRREVLKAASKAVCKIWKGLCR